MSLGLVSMTTPTSYERREVAERVRKTHGIMAFVEALGIDFDSDWCWTDVSRRVADLIDPTCEVEDMELRDEFDDATPYTLTLSCGHRMGAESYGDIPMYCPVCGARVVTHDEQD
jgi:hypothetical protein